MANWIDSRDDLDLVQKTMKKVEMFSRANIDWEDEAKIKEVL
jgi:hypothetical protein